MIFENGKFIIFIHRSYLVHCKLSYLFKINHKNLHYLVYNVFSRTENDKIE